MNLRTLVGPLLVAGLASALLLTACESPAKEPVEAVRKEPARPQFGAWGVDLAGMDTSVKPGDDFYGYVNGTWHANAEIPADKSDTGPANLLQDLALEQANHLLEEAAADSTAPEGSDRRRLGDWYASLLDEAKIDSLGLEPLRPELDRIAGVADRTALADLLAESLGGLGIAPLQVSWEFDRAHVGETLVSLATKGMSLPAREHYLLDEYQPVRDLFTAHVAGVFELAGLDESAKRAARVLSVEKKIAELTWPLAEQRDPRKKFNPTPAAELSEIAPGIDWTRFLDRAGVGAPEIVDVGMRSSVVAMAKLIAEGPLDAWRDYLTYRLLAGSQVALPTSFRDAFFDFYGRKLAAKAEPDPRWKDAVASIGWGDSALSDPLGRLFVERYVPEASRPQIRAMIDNLVRAFDARLAQLEWMTPETRAGARDKLSKTAIKVVYPDLWLDAQGLEVVRGDAIGNLRRAVAYDRARSLSYLKSYPDKRYFFKPVFEVNAYANPAWNEVVFLAAITRPPFFDPAADPAVNYGAMGAVIGHEVSHLFDDQGRLSDGEGLLRDWWTAKDAELFVAATDKLAEQVGSYEPLPGKHVNGRLTLGESIADVAGLTVAYDAFQLYLDGKQPEVKDGFTADQRFFLAYAQMWRWKPRDSYLDRLLKVDFHPPTFVRPQTVRNIDAWYQAFDVQPGTALYLAPEDRLNPW